MKKSLFFLLLSFALLPVPVFAGEVASRGVAVREVEADRVSLMVLVQADADEQAQASRMAGELARIVEGELKRLPAESVTVETASVRVTPVYYYKGKERTISYYNAMASWTVRGSAFQEILEMVNALSKREYGKDAFVRIDGLQWSLSPGLERKTREELIAEAVRHALANCVAALEALGLDFERVLKIEIDGASSETVRTATPASAGFSAARLSEAGASEPPMLTELKRGLIPCRMEVTLVAGF